MTSNIQSPDAQYNAVRTALKTSLYPGASDDAVDMVLAYCQAGGLDPMTRPVHVVPMWVPEKKQGNRVISPAGMRDVIMPGIELYRTKAHRTGQYAGQDEAEYGSTITETLGGVQIRYPEWCKVTVYRHSNGQRVPYSAKVYWLETYATAKRDTDAPNAMWKKRPWGQLEKCAEALALRKAFPEAVGAQPTAEEMEGKSLDATVREKDMGNAVQADASALPNIYPADRFATNFPIWRSKIESGEKTPEQIIALVENDWKMTGEQKMQVMTLEPIDNRTLDAEIMEKEGQMA